jgi:hypothetical protein
VTLARESRRLSGYELGRGLCRCWTAAIASIVGTLSAGTLRDIDNAQSTSRTPSERRPHLPTTLKRRLRSAGFEDAAIDVVPVLNADYDPNTYSARHIEIISDYVTRHGIAPDDARAWAYDLLERAKLGEYFFSLNRYFFAARKSCLS